MAELTWHKVQKVALTERLIMKALGDRESDLVQEVTRGQVAFDGAFLHIEPEGTSGGQNPPVSVVPAVKLKHLTYERSKPSGPMVAWG
jgi:hypothetical protein